MASDSLGSVVSHWSTLIENFQASPLSFYEATEAALLRRQVPWTKSSRVDHREGGVLSANREYLRITREKLIFDICAAPFGTGFFVSWWLVDDQPSLNALMRILAIFGMLGFALWIWYLFGLVGGTFVLGLVLFGGLAAVDAAASGGDFDDGIVRALPIIGPLYMRLFRPATYFRIDTMDMFQKAVHNAVLEVIDTMTTDKGVRALSESERKPIMREFYDRKGG